MADRETSLVERLFPLPDYRRTPLSLLRWWESRRGFYNRAVGVAGLVTLAGVGILEPGLVTVPGRELPVFIIVYAVMANVAYSMGWLAELAGRALWGSRAPEMGPLLFREGVVLAVGVTLLPLVLLVAGTLGGVLFGWAF